MTPDAAHLVVCFHLPRAQRPSPAHGSRSCPASARVFVVKWSERFSTGVPALDEQHQMLFKMSEDYRQALVEHRGDRVYGLLLDSLDRYARAHFAHEERCMHRYACPAAEANAEAHGGFVRQLDAFRGRYGTSGFSEPEAWRLVEFIDKWLMEHIGRVDTQLKPCVARMESASDPRE
jgi:hemerythrin